MSAPNLEAIKKQVEFYFSDSNYRKDNFLRTAAGSDPEGFVPINVLLTFNKLKQMTSDPAVVAEAIKDSDSLVLHQSLDKVKRSQPLPEVDTSTERTLYAKGFPLDESVVSIDSITQFFSQFGKVNMVKLRRGSDRKFKGSVLVEFSTVQEMQAALTASVQDGIVQLEFNGTKLVQVCTFTEWHQEHKAFIASKRKGGEKRKTEDADGAAAKESGASEEKQDAEGSEPTEETTFEAGLLLKLTGLDSVANAVELKNHLKTFAEVKFVELEADGAAVVRTNATAEADKLIAAANSDSGLLFGDKKLAAELISGEQEKAFWQRFSQRGKESGAGGRGGGRGGRGRGGRGGRGFKRLRR